MQTWASVSYVVSALLAVAGLVVLLLAMLRDRARGRKRCPRCFYDMSGAPSRTCPECGKTARSDRQLGRTRRHWRAALIGAAILLLGGASGVLPAAISGRWVQYTPAGVLNLALTLFETEAKAAYEANLGAGGTAQRLYLQRLLQGAPPPPPAGAAAAPTLRTTWNELLIAHHCARQLRLQLSGAAPAPTPTRMQIAANTFWTGATSDPYCEELMQLGVNAKPAFPALIAMLRSDDAATADRAARVFEVLGAAADSARSDLRSVLRHGQADHARRHAARLLAQLMAAQPSGVTRLSRAAEHERSPLLRAAALDQLALQTSDLSVVKQTAVRCHNDPDPGVRTSAVKTANTIARVLAGIDPPGKPVHALGLTRNSRNSSAADADPELVMVIVRGVQDTDADVRRAAAEALALTHYEIEGSRGLLIKAMHAENDRDTRFDLLRAVVRLQRPVEVLGELRRVLRLADQEMGLWVIGQLVMLSRDAEPVVPAALEFIQALKVHSPHNAGIGIVNLARIKGVSPRQWTPLLEDPERKIYLSALEGLRVPNIDVCGLSAPLLKLGTGEDADAADMALTALARCPADSDAILSAVGPWLRRHRADPRFAWARLAAVNLVGIAGRDAPAAAVPVLVESLDDASAGVLGAAVEHLRRHGPDARSALPRLRAMLDEVGSELARRVEGAIDHIDAAPAPRDDDARRR